VKHTTIASEQRQLDLSFVHRQGQTLLDRRIFSYPYVLMRTFRDPAASVHFGSETASRLTAIVQNSSGPIHDRDHLRVNLALDAATNVLLTYQGATTILRARSGNTSRERLSISLGDGAHLSYLPEARIYFPDARHEQITEIDLSPGSSLLFVDSFTVHDPENQSRPLAELDNTLTIRRDGEIVLLDRQHLKTPSFSQRFRAFASILLVGHPQPQLPEIPNLYAAVSALPSNLGWGIRLAAPDLRPIRELTTALATSAPRPLGERVA